MTSKMNSFRLDTNTIKIIEVLSDNFECSKTDIIEQLIAYAACKFSDFLDENSVSDVIKSLALWNFGYDWKEKLYDLIPE